MLRLSFQLDLILNLLGCPPLDEISSASDGAKSYVLSKSWRLTKVNAFTSLSKHITQDHDAIQLLLRMFAWDPRKRISVNQALGKWIERAELVWLQSMENVSEHPYIHEGRIRYHSCMCRCCFPTSNGRQYSSHLEPIRGFRYDDSDESFSTLRQGKGKNGIRRPRMTHLPFFRIHTQVTD